MWIDFSGHAGNKWNTNNDIPGNIVLYFQIDHDNLSASLDNLEMVLDATDRSAISNISKFPSR